MRGKGVGRRPLGDAKPSLCGKGGGIAFAAGRADASNSEELCANSFSEFALEKGSLLPLEPAAPGGGGGGGGGFAPENESLVPLEPAGGGGGGGGGGAPNGASEKDRLNEI